MGILCQPDPAGGRDDEVVIRRRDIRVALFDPLTALSLRYDQFGCAVQDAGQMALAVRFEVLHDENGRRERAWQARQKFAGRFDASGRRANHHDPRRLSNRSVLRHAASSEGAAFNLIGRLRRSTPFASAPLMAKTESFGIVVIGGSAGAVESVMALGGALPGDLDAAVLIALHVSPSAPSVLTELIGRRSALAVSSAIDGDEIVPGRIYVAQPDLHLVVEAGRIKLGRGPRENGHRPAVDPLFRTAARIYRNRVIGVVLSGNLDDGSSGLREIRACGGRAIVLDPADCAFAGMPSNAIDVAGADAVVPAAELAPTVVEFVRQVARQASSPVPESGDISTGGQHAMMEDEREIGRPSAFGCPDCGGVLWEYDDGQLARFRCRVGHAYNEEALLEAQNEGIERAMWAALRALEESAEQAGRIVERMQQRGHTGIAQRFTSRAQEYAARAEIIRRALHGFRAPQQEETN